jgi:hypothetical protein
MVEIQGFKLKTTGKILIAPNNQAVSDYLAAAKKGKGLAKNLFKNLANSKKKQKTT